MEYYIDLTTRYPPQAVKTRPVLCKSGVRILEEIFNPCGTRARAFRSAILVSLDVEYSRSTRKIFQVGIAKLDTRELLNHDVEEGDEKLRSLIGHRLFLIRQKPEPPHQHTRPYLFGSAEPLASTEEELDPLLHSIFTPLDPFGKPRNVVLVGHMVIEDFKALRWYAGIDLVMFSSIKAIVDTSSMAGGIYDGVCFKYSSLKRTCEYLGLEAKHFHNAGNDAFFTLLALLLLFCHHKHEKQHLTAEWIALQPACSDAVECLVDPDRLLLWECQLELLRRIGRAQYINTITNDRKEKIKPPASVVQNNLGDITDGFIDLFE